MLSIKIQAKHTAVIIINTMKTMKNKASYCEKHQVNFHHLITNLPFQNFMHNLGHGRHSQCHTPCHFVSKFLKAKNRCAFTKLLKMYDETAHV